MGSWRLNPCEVKARLSERQGQAEARSQQPAGAQAGGPGPGRRVGTRPGMETRPEGGGAGGREASGAQPVLSVPVRQGRPGAAQTEGDGQHISMVVSVAYRS